MEEKNFGNDIITLTDDDGKNYEFEIIDAIETDDGRYLAMIPYFSDPKARLDDSGELVIVKVFEDENGTIIYSEDRLESWLGMNRFMQAGICRYLLLGLYEDRLAYFESIKGYSRILHGEDAETVRNEVMTGTGEKTYDSGYYHEKTVR